jgi:hypothetical protein
LIGLFSIEFFALKRNGKRKIRQEEWEDGIEKKDLLQHQIEGAKDATGSYEFGSMTFGTVPTLGTVTENLGYETVIFLN